MQTIATIIDPAGAPTISKHEFTTFSEIIGTGPRARTGTGAGARTGTGAGARTGTKQKKRGSRRSTKGGAQAYIPSINDIYRPYFKFLEAVDIKVRFYEMKFGQNYGFVCTLEKELTDDEITAIEGVCLNLNAGSRQAYDLTKKLRNHPTHPLEGVFVCNTKTKPTFTINNIKQTLGYVLNRPKNHPMPPFPMFPDPVLLEIFVYLVDKLNMDPIYIVRLGLTFKLVGDRGQAWIVWFWNKFHLDSKQILITGDRMLVIFAISIGIPVVWSALGIQRGFHYYYFPKNHRKYSVIFTWVGDARDANFINYTTQIHNMSVIEKYSEEKDVDWEGVLLNLEPQKVKEIMFDAAWNAMLSIIDVDNVNQSKDGEIQSDHNYLLHTFKSILFLEPTTGRIQDNLLVGALRPPQKIKENILNAFATKFNLPTPDKPGVDAFCENFLDTVINPNHLSRHLESIHTKFKKYLKNNKILTTPESQRSFKEKILNSIFSQLKELKLNKQHTEIDISIQKLIEDPTNITVGVVPDKDESEKDAIVKEAEDEIKKWTPNKISREIKKYGIMEKKSEKRPASSNAVGSAGAAAGTAAGTGGPLAKRKKKALILPAASEPQEVIFQPAPPPSSNSTISYGSYGSDGSDGSDGRGGIDSRGAREIEREEHQAATQLKLLKKQKPHQQQEEEEEEEEQQQQQQRPHTGHQDPMEELSSSSGRGSSGRGSSGRGSSGRGSSGRGSSGRGSSGRGSSESSSKKGSKKRRTPPPTQAGRQTKQSKQSK
jgi:hypothetical protein